MGVAISALLAALAVIYSLIVTSTQSAPVETLLRVILNTFAGPGSGRLLTADEAMTALFFSVVIYLVTFSASYFVLRFFGTLLLALGVPDDDALRVNRQRRGNDDPQVRQAKLIAYYMNNESGFPVTHPDRSARSNLPRL